jgi:uncharacterized protein (UPF0371 family)
MLSNFSDFKVSDVIFYKIEKRFGIVVSKFDEGNGYVTDMIYVLLDAEYGKYSYFYATPKELILLKDNTPKARLECLLRNDV